MSIKQFQCPACGAQLDYADSYALTMRCPYCNSSVIVPESLRTAERNDLEGVESVLDGSHTAQLAEVARLLSGGNKIGAIKLFRETFDVGLKEAKDAVDAMETGQAVDITSFNTVTIVTNQPGTTLDSNVSAEIMRLVQSGNKIAAIKLIRERTGLGLAEAKNAVEAMEMAHRMAGALGGYSAHATQMSAGDTVDNLVNVVDGTPNFTPKVTIEGQRRGCGWLPLLLLLLVGAALFAPLPWVDWSESLDLPTEIMPANDQSLWQKFAEAATGGIAVASSPVLLSFGESGTGQGAFSDAREVARDGEGNLYTADYDTGRVQRFNEAGEFLSLFRLEGESTIQDIVATRDDDLYILQNGKVVKVDGETGELLDTVSPGGLVAIVTGMGVAPDGALLMVTMGTEERVVRLSQRGNNTNRLNIENPFMVIDSQAQPLTAIAEDGVGNIYVLAIFSGTILKFNRQGIFVNQFGAGDIPKLGGSALTIDSKGRLYVAHTNGILVYDGETGRRLTEIETDGTPRDIEIGADDTLWVVTSREKAYQYRAIDAEEE